MPRRGVKGALRLAELVPALSGATALPTGLDVPVHGICSDSRRLRPGELFVAVARAPGDGEAHVAEALGRGAAAVVAEWPIETGPAPLLRVVDSRIALAELAAAWFGRPAERIPVIGITGSLGKTSVLSMLAAILAAAGQRVGTIGSLGIRFAGEVEATRLTTPTAPTLHRALHGFVAGRAAFAAMEVTSHALDQHRVHGIRFGLGIFTNLVLLEHLDYHGSFRAYVEAKRRFFDHLEPGAPVVIPVGDRAVRALAAEYEVVPVRCGPGGTVSLRFGPVSARRSGTRVELTVRRPIPRLDGGEVAPVRIPLSLQVLGRPSVQNAGLAATTALCLGAPAEAVQDALASFRAPWRRMQLTRFGRFTVLDDTVGHPDSLGAVFEVALKLPHRRILVVYAVRGRRGEEINRRDAEALALWARHVRLATLLVTSSADVVGESDRVSSGERDAVIEMLRRYGVAHEYHDRLGGALDRLTAQVREGDLVLLIGAQGMNRGAALLRERLG